MYAVNGGKQGLLRKLIEEWSDAPMVAEAREHIENLNGPEEIVRYVAEQTAVEGLAALAASGSCPCASVSPQTGVDTCAEVRALSGAAEQGNQSGTLIAIETVEDLAFETIDDGVGLIEQHTRSVSQANAMCAAIPRVAFASHQFATFQFVDETDHRIAMHPK